MNKKDDKIKFCVGCNRKIQDNNGYAILNSPCCVHKEKECLEQYLEKLDKGTDDFVKSIRKTEADNFKGSHI